MSHSVSENTKGRAQRRLASRRKREGATLSRYRATGELGGFAGMERRDVPGDLAIGETEALQQHAQFVLGPQKESATPIELDPYPSPALNQRANARRGCDC